MISYKLKIWTSRYLSHYIIIYMLLTAFHMWNWLSKYGRFQVHKIEWKNRELDSISTK
jgi:hypothetical protein